MFLDKAPEGAPLIQCSHFLACEAQAETLLEI